LDKVFTIINYNREQHDNLRAPDLHVFTQGDHSVSIVELLVPAMFLKVLNEGEEINLGFPYRQPQAEQPEKYVSTQAP
jgi:hypothetical protein